MGGYAGGDSSLSIHGGDSLPRMLMRRHAYSYKVSPVQGYHVDIEYNERADEKTVICGGFAKISLGLIRK